jgi:tetratricopeptide (TPR) repeat protein
MCSETLAPGELSATARRDRPTEDVEFLPQGTPVGRYVLLSHLGQGGMGVVYTAHDPQLQRVVAIKLLRPQGAEGESSGQSRLLREAQAMAQLSHPNVVQVFDCGTFRDGIFIAMEFVRGQALDAWLAATGRPWQEVLGVFLQAGRGLAAAHASDILHRDFKPPNVLLGEDGRPRVSDFGLARSRRRGATAAEESQRPAVPGPLSLDLTQVGSLMGSPSYMSPEQHAGEATTAATDQYSFCVSLYEGLYGKRPFEASTLAGLAELKQGAPAPPPGDSPVPAWVHRALLRGLAPSPSDRFPDMAGLLAALQVDPSRAQRRRLQLAGVGLSVVGLLAGLGAYFGAARARSCEGVEAPALRAWSPAVQQRVEAAFLGTDLPYAPETLGRVRSAMAAWATAWGTERRAACEAASVRREQTSRQQLLRVSCLERKLEEFDALAGALAVATPDAVTHAADAVQRLPVLADCADVKWLEDRSAPPEALRGQAAELEASLARARGVANGGELAAARTQMRDAADKARGLGLTGLEAEAHAALGELELRAFDYEQAHAAFGTAVRAALAAGDDRLAARVLSRLVSVVGWRLLQPRQALLLGDMAEALLQRTGQAASLRALLAEGRGDAHWAAGAKDTALAHYGESLRWVEADAGPGSLDAARLRSSIAWMQMEKGEVISAREGIQQALAAAERLLGPSNPGLSDGWCDLSTIEFELLDLEAAAASARRCATLRDAGRAPPLGRAVPRLLLATALLQAGRFEQAAKAYDEAETLLSGKPAEGSAAQLHMMELESQVLAATGSTARAVSLAGEAIQRAEQMYGKQHAEVLDTLAALARVQSAAGDNRAALASWDRYRAVFRAGGARLSPLAAAGLLERAELLLPVTQDPAAVREEAKEALAALDAGGPPVGARLAARRRWAEALWSQPVHRAEARGLLEAALPNTDGAGRSETESWLASHRD